MDVDSSLVIVITEGYGGKVYWEVLLELSRGRVQLKSDGTR